MHGKGSVFRRHNYLAALTALATTALLWAVGPGTDPASAAAARGTLTIVPSGKAADAFGVGAVAPARRGRATVTFPVAGLTLGRPARATLRGGLRIRAGGRRATLTALRIVARAHRLSISARLGDKRRTFLLATLPPRRLDLDRTAGKLSLSRTPLALTRGGARALRGVLGLERVAPGAFGRVSLDAAVKRAAPKPGPTGPPVDPRSNPPANPPVDPYAFCPVAAGAAPGTPAQPGPPAAAPSLSSPQAIAGGAVDWGFRASFRGYVSGGSNGNPPISTQGGAAINSDGSFNFPVAGGQVEGGHEPRAVVEGEGAAVFCYPSHFFRIAMLNPTVTIDGAQSRLTIDVDSNVSGTEYGPWRSDLAALDVSAIEPEYSNDGQTVTWRDVPATLTADGAAAFVGFYAAGAALDPLTVTVGEPLTGPLTSVVSRADADLDPAQSLGDSDSEGMAVSANGRYVTFDSYAANLVPGDGFDTRDVFVRDLLTRRTARVSVDSVGQPGGGSDPTSHTPQISADGRYVAFVSGAALVVADTNDAADVYVRDTVAGTTELVTVATDATAAGGLSGSPSISADGRRVAFFSSSDGVAAGDSDGVLDAFVRDLDAGTTARVSLADNESESTVAVRAEGGISADGGHVVFGSPDDTLVAGDSNTRRDVFVRDLDAATTTRVSLGDDESQVTGAHVELGSAAGAKVSGDGNLIVFYSTAATLVAGDANGVRDCFVRDVAAQTTRRVNVGAAGSESAVACGTNPTISADGSTVAFSSEASDLVTGDANGVADVFFRALADPATIQRTNVATDGTEDDGTGVTGAIALDEDGGRVAFKSAGQALTGSNAGRHQVLVRELP
jgi:TolB protein